MAQPGAEPLEKIAEVFVNALGYDLAPQTQYVPTDEWPQDIRQWMGEREEILLAAEHGEFNVYSVTLWRVRGYA